MNIFLEDRPAVRLGRVVRAIAASLIAMAASPGTASAACGDSIVEPAEQCDDGGFAAGDGCGATCQLENGAWYPMGPEGAMGGVTSIAVHPSDPATAYIKTYHGVYKTTDAGVQWRRVAFNPLMHGNSPIVINPVDPNIVYSGSLVSGVWKSTNGGTTWATTALPLTQIEGALALDPGAPSTVYAGGSGLYKSTNAGSSWTNLSSNFGFTQIRCLGVGADGAVYAGTDSGLRKSTDGGTSWIDINNGITVPVVRQIVPDPADAQLILLRSGGKLYRTTDGGAIWNEIVVPGSFGIDGISVDPADPDRIATASNLGVSLTTNGGGSWSSSTSGFNTHVGESPSTDLPMHVALVPGLASRVYAINYRGVHQSNDSGTTWSFRSTGVRAVQHHDVAISSGTGDVMYVASLSVGLFHSSDHGRTWNARNTGLLTSPDLVVVDASDASHVYAAGGTRLYYSSDSGQSWTHASTLPIQNIDAVAVDPTDGDRVYVGNTTVWTSADGGASWTEGGTETQGENVRWIDVTAAGTVYARTDTGLYRSTNQAASWTSIGAPPVAYRRIAEDPTNPNVLYAATSTAGVYRSTDGGGSWAAANTDLPPNAPREIYGIAIEPAQPQNIVVATQDGVFRSFDGAATWKAVGSTTQPTLLRDLALDPTFSATYYVPSQFGGLYRAAQPCGNGVTDAGETCDDGDAVAGDGCTVSCQVQECWQCSGTPSTCSTLPTMTSCTDDGVFCNGAERCFNGNCGHLGNPCAPSICPGTETCLGGLCFPSATPCTSATPCMVTCVEASDTCGPTPGAPCDSACGDGTCDMAGTCQIDDGDGDAVGDLCDNCPVDPNAEQDNADCDDETFLESGGCAGPLADEHAGCCDGGDLCDDCPGLADNDACASGDAQSIVVDGSGGSISGPLADIEIPAGAVGDATVITVEDAAPETPADELTFSLADGIAATLAASPEGMHFAAPVVITLRWSDRDADGLVDGGTCVGGTDADDTCDEDADCQSADCTTHASSLTESEMTLKRNGQRFSSLGFGAGPYTCADHLAGACTTAAASCASAPGTGTATVAACCDPSANTWRFETCDFSEFFVGRTAGDLILGGGSPKSDCVSEWSVRNPDNTPFLGRRGTINAEQTCTDGDATCDRDGAVNGSCTFEVTACVNVEDPRVKLKGLIACPPADFYPLDTNLSLVAWVMKKPRPDSTDTQSAANAIALRDAIANLAPGNSMVEGKHLERVSFPTALSGVDRCTEPVEVVVPIEEGEETSRSFKFQAISSTAPSGAKNLKDSDLLTLTCQP